MKISIVTTILEILRFRTDATIYRIHIDIAKSLEKVFICINWLRKKNVPQKQVRLVYIFCYTR